MDFTEWMILGLRTLCSFRIWETFLETSSSIMMRKRWSKRLHWGKNLKRSYRKLMRVYTTSTKTSQQA